MHATCSVVLADLTNTAWLHVTSSKFIELGLLQYWQYDVKSSTNKQDFAAIVRRSVTPQLPSVFIISAELALHLTADQWRNLRHAHVFVRFESKQNPEDYTDVLAKQMRRTCFKGFLVEPSYVSKLSETFGCLTDSRNVLSPRQTEVLQLVANGYTNLEIAKILCIGRETVKKHLLNAFNRLGACNRTGAIMIALQKGWIM